MNESEVKKQIILPWLKSMNAWEFMPVNNGMGKGGVPDHIACVPITVTPDMIGSTIGIFVAPEAKASNKKHDIRPRQMQQMQLIDEARGITGVISCLEDCVRMASRIPGILQND